MSDLSEFKTYLREIAEDEQGHLLGPWHWAPIGELYPAHEAECKRCHGRMHIIWDDERHLWTADGDLVVCSCYENIVFEDGRYP